MKSSGLLAALIALIALPLLTWGGLQWRRQLWREWLDGASRSELESYSRSAGGDPQTAAKLAHQYLQEGADEQAKALMTEATQRFPQSPEILRSSGEILLSERRLPEAEKALRESLALKDDSETRLLLARVLTPLQRYPEIAALCAPLIASAPALTATPQQRASAVVYSAGARLNGPLTPAELQGIQSQLREAALPSSALPPEERFLADYFLGESLLREGKPGEAIPSLEKSVAQNPNFPGAIYSLARAYRLSGDEAKSKDLFARHERMSRLMSELDSLNTRLEQRPDDAETLLRMADALVEAGNPSQAAQIYRRLIVAGKSKDIAQRKLQALSSP